MQTKQVYFKTDFSLLEKSDVGYSLPFRFLYFAAAPSRGYEVSFDGVTYKNCSLDSDGNLLVTFDDHNLGCGTLMVRRTYYLNSDTFASGVCDAEIAAQKVVAEYKDTEGNTQQYNIVMSTSGDSNITAASTVQPYWAQGKDGTAATIKIGTVTQLESGTTPTVNNSGTENAAVFNFGIPKPKDGTDGKSTSVKIGNTTTVEPTESASVNNSGTADNMVLDFMIPKGEKGDKGVSGGILFPSFTVNPKTGYLTISGTDADLSRITFNPKTGYLTITA